jgi:formylglycine-generating enzyme required for sulfatase activity
VVVPGGTVTSDISDNLPYSSTVATFLMDLTEVTVSAYSSCVSLIVNPCAIPYYPDIAPRWAKGYQLRRNGNTLSATTTVASTRGGGPHQTRRVQSTALAPVPRQPWVAILSVQTSSAFKTWPGTCGSGQTHWYCGTPPCTVTGTDRVMRGGSWRSNPGAVQLRAAVHAVWSPASNDIGFRCARTP